MEFEESIREDWQEVVDLITESGQMGFGLTLTAEQNRALAVGILFLAAKVIERDADVTPGIN